MYGAPREATMKGPLGATWPPGAGTKAPGGGGRGARGAKRVEGFGLFK